MARDRTRLRGQKRMYFIPRKVLPIVFDHEVISDEGYFNFSEVARTTTWKRLRDRYCTQAYGYYKDPSKSPEEEQREFFEDGIADEGKILFFTEEKAQELIKKGDKCHIDDIDYMKSLIGSAEEEFALMAQTRKLQETQSKLSDQEKEIQELRKQLAASKKASAGTTTTKKPTKTEK